MVENGFEEMPVFGASGEEASEPEVITDFFIDVHRAEIALPGGGNIEAETVFFDFLVGIAN